jgi:hypothetical protein
MHDSVWAMLNETEKALLRDAEPRALAGLDEDELLTLHDRLRRARTKYAKLYRRRAAEQVAGDASRTRAHAAHARTVTKAEAFEEALARVSRLVAKAAKASADELKSARLAAARGATSRSEPRTRDGGGRSAPAGPGTGAGKAKRRTPATKRARASSRAATGRRQAARDVKGR